MSDRERILKWLEGKIWDCDEKREEEEKRRKNTREKVICLHLDTFALHRDVAWHLVAAFAKMHY